VGELDDVKLMKVAEVAKVLRLSKMTVYRMVDDRDLESFRIGRTILIPEQAVVDLLKAGYSAAK
jgi:excisionase family DNA binding protein